MLTLPRLGSPVPGDAAPRGDVSADRAARAVRRARLQMALLAAGLLAIAAFLALWRPPWGLETGPFFPAPEARPFRATVWIALFWASLANAGLAALGAATAGRWARPLPAAPPWTRAPRASRTLVLLLVLAALLALGLRWPLSGGSLWWDEIWSLTRVMRGFVEPDPEDPARLVLDDRSWARTLWYYGKPTNHVLYNLTSRAGLTLWRAAGDLPPEAFDERVFRAPALAAAGLAVLAMGVLGGRAGAPRAGVAAAFLLAIHPWHLRYGVEARAYSFLVLFALLACLGLLEALRRGRGRDFALAGGSILGMLWAHPFSAYFVLALAPLGLVGALRAPGPPARRQGLAWRWMATVTLAGMAFVQLMAPNLSQALTWENVWEEDRHALQQSVDYWGETATGISAGCSADDTPADPYPCLDRMEEGSSWAAPVIWGLLPLLTALGLARVLRRDGPARYPLAAAAIAVPITVLLVDAQGQLFYTRFAIYGLVPVVLGVALGADAVADRLARMLRRAWLAPLLLALALGAYQLLVLEQTRLLLTRPYAPTGATAQALRADTPEDPAESVLVGYGLGGAALQLYGPWIRYADTRAGLEEALREAAARGVPLRVAYGYESFNRGRNPGGFELLDDPRLFREMARLHGIEGQFRHRVLRWTGRLPGSVEEEPDDASPKAPRADRPDAGRSRAGGAPE